MPPNDGTKSGGIRNRPLETKRASDVFQSVGKGRKIHLRKDDRQEIHRVLDCHAGIRFRWYTVAPAHASQKTRLVAAIVQQHRLLDDFENAEEFPPKLSLILYGVRPQVVPDGGFTAANAQADEVVEVAVGQSLDIQIDRRAFDFEFRDADDVDFLLPNR